MSGVSSRRILVVGVVVDDDAGGGHVCAGTVGVHGRYHPSTRSPTTLENGHPHLRSSDKFLVGHRKRSFVGAGSTPHHAAASPPPPPPLRRPTTLGLYRSKSLVPLSPFFVSRLSAPRSLPTSPHHFSPASIGSYVVRRRGDRIPLHRDEPNAQWGEVLRGRQTEGSNLPYLLAFFLLFSFHLIISLSLSLSPPSLSPSLSLSLVTFLPFSPRENNVDTSRVSSSTSTFFFLSSRSQLVGSYVQFFV